MKRIGFLFFWFFWFVNGVQSQQVITDTNASLTALVEGLLGTNCVEISNVSSPYNGSVDGLNSFGAFSKGSSNFPFSNGIILTTGNANAAGNSQINAPLNDGTENWGTDFDLESTLGITNTLNATTLEFEFVSAVNTIQFNYILASEEYQQEYPCFYSDGFAILFKKAGTNEPYQNIALVPGTNIEVNTSTIHDTIEGFCQAENEEFFEGYNVGDTNYNGRTKVLSASASIEPNTAYTIKFIIADNVDERFDSAVFIEGNSFNAAVDLGPDVTTCASFVTLNAYTGNSLTEYEWFLNEVFLTSSSDPTLDVTESGNYKVIATSPIGSNSCILEDSIDISIDQEQTSAAISDYIICDDLSNDGTEWFDLSTKIPELLNSVNPSEYTIQFFTNASDAQNNTNPTNSDFQNSTSPQTIYVRMEDTETGCLAFPTFDLIVNPVPTAVSMSPYLLCQTQPEESFTAIDLSMFDNILSENNPNISVSYHHTQEDANNGDFPLMTPYNNPNSSETIFVRLENLETGCLNTTSFEIDFSVGLPIPSSGTFIDLCLDASEDFGVFDLTSVIPGLLNGLNNISVSYHLSYEEALQGLNPISNPEAFQNSSPNTQLIYIRFEDSATQCPTISTLTLHVNLLDNAFSDVFTSDVCDDQSNDGIANFDLQIVKQEVTLGFIDLNVDLYESLSDLNNHVNILDDTLPFEVSGGQETIYAEITSSSCTTIVEVTLLINEATSVNPVMLDYCDDVVSDGTTEIILSQLDSFVLQGIEGIVTYHLTAEDAQDNLNEITESYVNNSNPQRLFFRVTNSITNCSDTNHVDITVVERPALNSPTPLISCDLDGNGSDLLDLTTKVSEITEDFGQMTFEFYQNLEEAASSVNAIPDPENFTSTTSTVYVKVINNNTLCTEIIPLEIIVNSVPEITEVSPFINCTSSGLSIGEFYLSDKSNEILNGQSDKTVLYFESESDARSRTNPIDTSTPYNNISNPQILFYRIENITDTACFDTGSFMLEVRSAPEYNTPSDLFACNENSIGNQATVDLNEVIFELSDGSPDDLMVSFHPTLNDAENNSNSHPLTFTNSINPEPIFVRIENQEGCVSFESFELNVVAVPLINPAPNLIKCATDYDGQLSWDLTQVESEVLNIRQDNIEITYFNSTTDLEGNIDEISNPNDYVNSTLEETVYIKVTNTISNCYSFEPIHLEVKLPPTINLINSYEICESDNTEIDLSDINNFIYDGVQSLVDFAYFPSYSDAENNTNQLSSVYNYNSTADTLFVKVTDNDNGCFIIHPFELRINPRPTPGQLLDLETCDDDFDGMSSFNFSDQTTAILSGLDPSLHTVTYYESESDAELDINPLPSTYFAFDGQTIFVRLQETRTACYVLRSFKTTVHPKPELHIDTQTLCGSNGTVVVNADTGISGETYLWSTGATSSEIEIVETGLYSVTVTSPIGCETTSSFEVISSDSAFVDLIETVDFSDPNNIIITVTGSGDYLFSLNGGAPQQSNIFENVPLGIHQITISDRNGCASVIRTVIVVDAPKYFTPNGDGVNDRWHIIGIETIPGTSVTIFDRYGKHLASLDAHTEGWDGRYNGNNLPAGDYWFVADVVKNNEQFQVSGHFALRR
jgi:gliding motility-associated-like protein